MKLKLMWHEERALVIYSAVVTGLLLGVTILWLTLPAPWT